MVAEHARRHQSVLDTDRRIHVLYGVDVKIADANGDELPRDGESSGRLMVRGPWIASGYFRDAKPLLEDGWFNTGDLAVMDDDNHIRLTDREERHQVGR